MFKDEHKRGVWDTLRHHDLQALSRLLPVSMVREAAAFAGAQFGSGALNLATLVWLALLAALEKGRNFAGVLELTLKLLHDAQGWDGPPSPGLLPTACRRRGRRSKGWRKNKRRRKQDPRGGDPNLVSEEAFVQARKQMPPGFWVALIMLLSDCFQREHGDLVRWKKYRLLALDGTTINLPGRKALAARFGTSKNQRGSKTPQARMVMLQFPLTRLPWRYTLAPRTQGETTLAGPLLDQLCCDDLVLMDRCFFAYGLFWRIQQRQAFFAIRLNSSVKLKHVRKLGYKDRLVCWRPTDHARKWKVFPQSIELRVIDYQIQGFRPSAIVTNVTDPQAISRCEWVRLTTDSEPGRHLDVGLYHRRWEIETTFFELKVEQGMEGKLRGRTAECIEYEIAGHVILYLLTRWLMVEAATQSGKDPLRLSFLQATHEMNDLRLALLLATPQRIRSYLLPLLLDRIARHDVPWRPGRYDPRPGDNKLRNKGKGRYQLPSKLMKNET
jgi:transposase